MVEQAETDREQLQEMPSASNEQMQEIVQGARQDMADLADTYEGTSRGQTYGRAVMALDWLKARRDRLRDVVASVHIHRHLNHAGDQSDCKAPACRYREQVLEHVDPYEAHDRLHDIFRGGERGQDRDGLAWMPVAGSNDLKACPRCGETALEGEVECKTCGTEPTDDRTWRRMNTVRAPQDDDREGLVEDDAEGLVNRLITACEDAHGVSNTEWTDDVDEAYDTLLRALRDRLQVDQGESDAGE